ncbi:hypothetical protein BKA70DRAFT_1241751 [Coprinopsis sp. MPI-PUGE-AT-0042]|nr:hypothetical protein BKA70DRAFT_1241751 [Coprinopsis sp. MPI-PUGE-AT-0042]
MSGPKTSESSNTTKSLVMQPASTKRSESSSSSSQTLVSSRLLRSANAPARNLPRAPPLPMPRRAVRGRGDPEAGMISQTEGIMAPCHCNESGGPSTIGRAAEEALHVGQHETVVLEEGMRQVQQELVRVKRALENRKAKLRVAREDLVVAKQELEEAQGEIAELMERLEHANTTGEQYRNWWINEVQFTKIILSKVPNANQDWDLVRSSQSHYLGRF